MSKIRKSARGAMCMARLPGVCNFDNSTTVAAHIRVASLCGIGIKPSDILTIRACSACHDVIDGRVQKKGLDKREVNTYVLEALCRTLVEYEKEGLVKC